MTAYYLFRIAGWVLPHVPPGVAYAMSGWLGYVVAALMPRQRAVVRANLRHVLGPDASESELDRLAHRTYGHMLKNYFDLFRIPRLRPEQIRRMVTVDGMENVTAALGAGRGAIICSVHYGAVDVTAQCVSTLAMKMTGPAEHVKPEKLYRYLTGVRSSHGVRLLPSDGVLSELFRALRRNEIVALAVDRDTTKSGRTVEFFGAPACLPDGAAQLALRTGAPLIPAFARRTRDNRFRIVIEPPIWLDSTRDRGAAVEAGMRRLLPVVEKRLREDPEQWVMFSPIWND